MICAGSFRGYSPCSRRIRTRARPCQRQADPEARAAQRAVAYADLAAMIADDLAGNGQPEPGTAAFGSDEGLEQLVAQRGRDPRAIVLDLDAEVCLALALHGHAHVPAGLQGLARVAHEIQQDLLEQPAIHANLGHVAGAVE